MFCRSLFVLLDFSICQCLVCSSSIYGFWLPPFGILLFLLTCGKHVHFIIKQSFPAVPCCSTSGIHRVNLIINPVMSTRMRKGPGGVYYKCNISVAICGCLVCSSSIYGFWLPPFGILLFLLTCGKHVHFIIKQSFPLTYYIVNILLFIFHPLS
jgi:Mn2+/Fe2+ NRAMP family transporter